MSELEWTAIFAIVLLNTAMVGWFAYKLSKEVFRLRRDCAEAYQIIGAMSDESYPFAHPDVQRALDNMGAAANGMPRPHDDLLPWPRIPNGN